MERSFIRQILESINDKTISFAGGLPDESMFPLDDLAQASFKAFENRKSWQYGVSRGIPSLRDKIAQFYRDEGFPTEESNILITTGSQQGLFILAKFFEGSGITIEEPSYLGAMKIFGMNSLRMDPVALFSDGIDLEAFSRSFQAHRLAYVIPDFQNPMGSRYTIHARRHVASCITSYEGYLIEDAPYSELYFDQKLPSISSMCPERSFHLGSFSKSLAPSLRLGWVRAEASLIEKLTKIKETIDLHSCGIAQSILDHYLEDPSRFHNHLGRLRDHYRVKRDFFVEALGESLPQLQFAIPQGGMFVYGKLPSIDTSKLVQETLAKGVVFVPGKEFYLHHHVYDELRLNFTHTPADRVKEGLEIIASTLPF